jgi:hypothetical protein
MSCFSKAAARGDPDAQYVLGAMIYEGIGVNQDVRAAADWLKRAAMQGNEDSQRYLEILCIKHPSACN